MIRERDLTYLTAPFIAREIDHLARMIHSRHWHRSKAWTVSYWRQRIEELRGAPVVSDTQRSELGALLIELELIALTLENSSRYPDVPRAEPSATLETSA